METRIYIPDRKLVVEERAANLLLQLKKADPELYAYLKRLQREYDPVINIGALQFDIDKKTLHKHGVHIILQPTEYAVVEPMIRKVGRYIPFHEHIAMSWPNGNVSEVNTLTKYITRLRNKFDERNSEGNWKYLTVMTRLGYRLNEQYDS